MRFMKAVYLIWGHVKVYLHWASWSRVFDFVYCLARQNKLRQLLDSCIQIPHRLRFFQFLECRLVSTHVIHDGAMEDLPRVQKVCDCELEHRPLALALRAVA